MTGGHAALTVNEVTLFCMSLASGWASVRQRARVREPARGVVEAITRGRRDGDSSRVAGAWAESVQFGEVGLGRRKRPELVGDCGGGPTSKSGFPTLSLTSLQGVMFIRVTQFGEFFLWYRVGL